MRVGIFLSTLGGSPLQGGIERGLAALGHSVEQYRQGGSYDLIVVFNQCAHARNYQYPTFPACNTPIAFVDTAEFGYFSRLPEHAHKFKNTFSGDAVAHDTKNPKEQWRLKHWLKGRSFPYFLREMHKSVEYPASYHPIDYPLYHLSHCGKAPNRDEYLSRPLDLFLSWGASHPWRLPITEAIRNCHTKCEISVLQDGVVPRMPQGEYFQKQESAKLGVSFDGYGSGSFRMTEVLVRSCLVMAPLSIVTHKPLIDGETCRMYDVHSDGQEFTGTNVGDVVRRALECPEESYEIYARAYDHCHAYYTEKATAQYLLDTVERHDWNAPTEIEL